MKRRSMLMVSMFIGAVLMWGCETTPSSSVGGGATSQQEAARTVMDYRKLAAELREMAHRRELEAEMLAKQPNPDQARIGHWREMAQQLSKEAAAAEQHAQDMQRNVPHGMIQ